MSYREYTVTIRVKVEDAPRLYASAIKACEEKYDDPALLATDGVIDIPACLQMIFDPVLPPWGVAIIDAGCECTFCGSPE